MQSQRQIYNCVKQRFGKIVDGEILLIILKKRSIFDISQGSKYFSQLPASSTACKNQRALVTSGVTFAVNKWEVFVKIKNVLWIRKNFVKKSHSWIITTFWGCHHSKNKRTLSLIKILVVLIKKCIEALDELQDQ